MDLTTRLGKCYAAAVHDVLRAMGRPNCVLPHDIKPLDPTKKLAGEIYTVSGFIDQTRDAHETLVQWTGLLSKAPSTTSCTSPRRPRRSTSRPYRSRSSRSAPWAPATCWSWR